MNGAYAVWARAAHTDRVTSSNVLLLNIRRDIKTKLPRPEHVLQGSPSVSSDGTVYFLRERKPEHTQQIVKQPVGAQAEVLYTVPSNQRASDLYVDDRARARHVYFTVFEHSETDIYKLIDPLPSL